MTPFDADPNLRAADADRERVITALNQNFRDGRLDADELGTRIGMALAAKTFGDLDEAMADLPPLRRPAPPPPETLYGPALPLYGPAPTYYVAPRERSGLAMASSILGVTSLFCLIPAPLAVILGGIALFADRDNPRADRTPAIVGIGLGLLWPVVFLTVGTILTLFS